MKKLCVLITAGLLLALCACTENANDGNPDLPQNNTPTQSVLTQSPTPHAENKDTYVQGTFTTEYYYSRWLNLYLKIPADMEALDPEVLERYNEGSIKENPNTSPVTEMYVYQKNDDELPSVQIVVSKNAENESLKSWAKSLQKDMNENFKNWSVNGLHFEAEWMEPANITFLGAEYLLSGYHSKTYYNSALNREGNTWFLLRKKDGRKISITCSANGNTTLEDILSLFTTYAEKGEKNNTPSPEPETNEDGSIRGKCSGDSFYSKWLNLRYDCGTNLEFSENMCETSSSGFIMGLDGELLYEMTASQISPPHKQVQILIKKLSETEELNDFADVITKAMIFEEAEWKEPTEYVFLEENYLLYEVRENWYVDTDFSTTVDWWFLFREKDGYAIMIWCNADIFYEATIDDMLEDFDLYQNTEQ